MTGRHHPVVDRDAARAAGLELARVVDIQRTRPADVAHVRLPLAMEVLDHCGGDSIMAICVMASLVNPAATPPPLPMPPGPLRVVAPHSHPRRNTP